MARVIGAVLFLMGIGGCLGVWLMLGELDNAVSDPSTDVFVEMMRFLALAVGGSSLVSLALGVWLIRRT